MTYAPHPGPGRAVLACRCGKMLDSADMCRRRHERQEGSAALVERITCAACADVNVPLGESRWGRAIPDVDLAELATFLTRFGSEEDRAFVAYVLRDPAGGAS